MTTSRRSFLVAGASLAAALPASHVRAQATRPFRIGVLTDMSGPYKDLGGPGVVACVRQAVQDAGVAGRGLTVEVLVGDHQNRPDVGVELARQWFDRDGVDCVCDINNSAVAIALTGLCVARDKLQLNTGAASSALIAQHCTPNLVHWTFDSWQSTHATCVPIVRDGGRSWFFLAADYTFGHDTARDAAAFVRGAGGNVAGSVFYPFPATTDFSSFLLQAQAGGAGVLGLATSGQDTVNVVKQAAEFGLQRQGMRLAGLSLYINDVHGIGLETGQGLLLSEMFYWDMNARTRAFAGRVRPAMGGNAPNQEQAGGYSGVLNYLRAVAALGASARSGRAVVAWLKRSGLDDDALGTGTVRADGQALHPAFLFRVKRPQESRGTWDLYDLVDTVPAEQAFRPMAEETGCSLAGG